MIGLMALHGTLSASLLSWDPQFSTGTTQRDCQNQVEGKDPFPGPAGCSWCQHGPGGGWLPLPQGYATDPLQLVLKQHPGPFGTGAFLQASGTSPSLDLSVMTEMTDSSFMVIHDSSLSGLQCVLSGPTDQLI